MGNWGGEAGVGLESGQMAADSCHPPLVQDSALARSDERPGSRSVAGINLVEAALVPGSWGCVAGRGGGGGGGASLDGGRAPCAPAFGMLRTSPVPDRVRRGWGNLLY